MWISKRIDENTAVTVPLAGCGCGIPILGFALVAVGVQLAKAGSLTWLIMAAVATLCVTAIVWVARRQRHSGLSGAQTHPAGDSRQSGANPAQTQHEGDQP